MILSKFSLEGKTAIVTGASRGLGQGMAVGLAEAGADVAVVASSERIQETVEIVRSLGKRCIPIQADLGSIDPIPRIIDTALKEFGKIDILVNCAGIILRAPAIEVTEQDWNSVINLNQKTLFFMCQAAAKEMIKQKRGKIINVASVLSFQGGVLVPAYAASKAAVASITRSLANEWAPLGINVNAIAPGYMATEMTDALQNNLDRSSAILSRIPQGRWGTPEDMKGAVVFLASKASDYLQAHVLTIDGGWLSR